MPLTTTMPRTDPVISLDDGLSFIPGLELYQAEINALDLSFLDDIPVADGLFHLPMKDKKLCSCAEVDSDDDSTVDLTDSSHSSRSHDSGSSFLDDSSHGTSNGSSGYDEKDSMIVVDHVKHESQQSPEIPASSRPQIGRTLRNSFRRSFKQFKIQETDATKERIRVAALRSKIRQQRHRNTVLAEQLQQSKERKRDLAVAIQQKEAAFNDQFQKCVIEAGDDGVHVCVEGMKAQKRAVDLKREQLAKEAAEIRAILDTNAERLEILRKERNEQAAKRLNLELFMAQMGIDSSTERLLLSESALRTERLELRSKLGLKEGETLETMEIRTTHQTEAKVAVLETLSDSVSELQNSKSDLSEAVGDLRRQLGYLQATKIKQQANIEALEHNYLALTDDELHILDEVAEKAKLTRRKGLGRFFRRGR